MKRWFRRLGVTLLVLAGLTLLIPAVRQTFFGPTYHGVPLAVWQNEFRFTNVPELEAEFQRSIGGQAMKWLDTILPAPWKKRPVWNDLEPEDRTEILETLLDDPDPRVVAAALSGVNDNGGRISETTLRKFPQLLDHPNSEIRRHAAGYLAQSPSPSRDSVPFKQWWTISKDLEFGYEFVVWDYLQRDPGHRPKFEAALNAMVRDGTAPNHVRSRLLDWAFDNRHPHFHWRLAEQWIRAENRDEFKPVLEAIASHGQRNPQAAGWLLPLLRDAEHREQAVRALLAVEIESPADVRTLLAALDDPDAKVRSAAENAFAAVRDLGLLQKFLADPRPTVRAAAFSTFEQRAGPTRSLSWADLVPLFYDEGDTHANALDLARSASSNVKTLLQVLEKALEEPFGPRYALPVLRTLQNQGRPLKAKIEALCESKDTYIMTVVAGLETLGEVSESREPAIQKLLAFVAKHGREGPPGVFLDPVHDALRVLKRWNVPAGRMLPSMLPTLYDLNAYDFHSRINTIVQFEGWTEKDARQLRDAVEKRAKHEVYNVLNTLPPGNEAFRCFLPMLITAMGEKEYVQQSGIAQFLHLAKISENELAKIHDLIRHPDETVAKYAFQALTYMRPVRQETVEALLRYWDAAPLMRRDLVWAFGALEADGKPAASRLKAYLPTANRADRRAALQSLGLIGTDPDEMIPTFKAMLQSRYHADRETAVRALQGYAEKSDEIVSLWIDRLRNDSHFSVRFRALGCLIDTKPASKEALDAIADVYFELAPRLPSEEPLRRWMPIPDTPGLMQILARVADDPEKRFSLGWLHLRHQPYTVTALEAMLQSKDSARVNQALSLIPPVGREASSVVPELAKLLKTGPADRQRKILDILLNLGDDAAAAAVALRELHNQRLFPEQVRRLLERFGGVEDER